MFQVRSEETGIREFNTFGEAAIEAEKDQTIWKLSFTLVTGERIRLVRYENKQWRYEPLEV